MLGFECREGGLHCPVIGQLRLCQDSFALSSFLVLPILSRHFQQFVNAHGFACGYGTDCALDEPQVGTSVGLYFHHQRVNVVAHGVHHRVMGDSGGHCVSGRGEIVRVGRLSILLQFFVPCLDFLLMLLAGVVANG